MGMVLKNFFISVMIRVILILATSLAVGIILPHTGQGYYYTLSGAIFLVILQSWLLVNFVNRTNNDLERFFSSVHDHDSSIRFSSGGNGRSFERLYGRMNHVNKVIRDARIENERSGRFLQCLVDQVDVGLLSFDSSGKIEIYNRAARRYLPVIKPANIADLRLKDEVLYRAVSSVEPGSEILHKAVVDNLIKSVLIRAAEFRMDDRMIKLVSFQDITGELDRKELDSWQKLIRVLTHEIMNSISPVTSLTRVISGYFKSKDDAGTLAPEKLDPKVIDKTLLGLNTIEETGKGLLDFVDKYRSLASLPEPEVSTFRISGLFSRTVLLMQSSLAGSKSIDASVHPNDLTLTADYSQVEQVLINLIKNSLDSLSGMKNGIIRLKAFHGNGYTIIQVGDNGPGIPADIIEDIFIPFYTTKENGSGIGLSLSRQIMQNHRGSISAESIPGRGARFTLKF